MDGGSKLSSNAFTAEQPLAKSFSIQTVNGVATTVSTLGINPAGDVTIGNLTVSGTLTAIDLSYIPWRIAG